MYEKHSALPAAPDAVELKVNASFKIRRYTNINITCINAVLCTFKYVCIYTYLSIARFVFNLGLGFWLCCGPPKRYQVAAKKVVLPDGFDDEFSLMTSSLDYVFPCAVEGDVEVDALPVADEALPVTRRSPSLPPRSTSTECVPFFVYI